jgi:hypothetical protein
MIKEDYVSFEITKLLKEKGFDEPCYMAYVPTNRKHMMRNDAGHSNSMHPDDYYAVPTLQMAMKWLRKIYGIDIVIEISDPSVKDRKYYCVIWDGNNNSHILDLFNSNEEACEAAIKYCLKKLI